VGVDVAVGVDAGVTVAVAVGVTVGAGVGVDVAVGVGVGVGEPDCAQYLPPVFKAPSLPNPPQTIISLPLQTAVKLIRAMGALVVLVVVQLSAPGLYLPPVFKKPESPSPPQTII
jgi:hypothetical protein